MRIKRPNSLKSLLFIHEIAFFLLVVITGTIAGLSAYFWQQSSAESVRINNLIYITEQIRSDLYRQIQEVIRARVLEDPSAPELYLEYSSRIDKQFNSLRSRAASGAEDKAIQALQTVYREIQQDMNKIFKDPYTISQQVRINILDPEFVTSMIGRFENKYVAMKTVLSDEHSALDERLEYWTVIMPYIIPFTLLIAIFLILFARNILSKGFIRPMSHVIEGAKIISQGQLDHVIPGKGVQEVSDLAQAINSMAADLEASRHALVESEKQAALGALVPVVAHNIRNPLASIRATAQVIDNLNDVKELNESKQAILDTIDSLDRWVNALVSYLHPLRPNYRLVPASKLLDAAVLLLKPRLEANRIKVEKIGWENDLRLNADPDLMEQAIYALLANAIDASPEASLLRISMIKKDTELEMHIQDNGPGLPFDPKPGKLEPGPSTKQYGTGLGIPIAFKICQQHGWKLSFQIDKDKGTDAIITAPIRVFEELIE